MSCRDRARRDSRRSRYLRTRTVRARARSLAWRSGPLFVSFWVRNVSGTGPRICLWQMPSNACAAMPPLPSKSIRFPVVPIPDDRDA